MYNIIKVVANIAKRQQSISEFEHQIYLIDQCDGDTGDSEHSR